MIEIVDAGRCTACNICVNACPTNVFEVVEGAPPRIARQQDCQTCFMCELYCPEDALFVAPHAEQLLQLSPQAAMVQQHLGGYRRDIGWVRGAVKTASLDGTYALKQHVPAPH